MFNIDKAIRIASIVVDELYDNNIKIDNSNIDNIVKFSLFLMKNAAERMELPEEAINRFGDEIYLNKEFNNIVVSYEKFIQELKQLSNIQNIQKEHNNSVKQLSDYESQFSTLNYDNKESVNSFIQFILNVKQNDERANRSIYIATPLGKDEINKADYEGIKIQISVFQSDTKELLKEISEKKEVIKTEISNYADSAMGLLKADAPLVFLEENLKRRFRRDFKLKSKNIREQYSPKTVGQPELATQSAQNVKASEKASNTYYLTKQSALEPTVSHPISVDLINKDGGYFLQLDEPIVAKDGTKVYTINLNDVLTNTELGNIQDIINVFEGGQTLETGLLLENPLQLIIDRINLNKNAPTQNFISDLKKDIPATLKKISEAENYLKSLPKEFNDILINFNNKIDITFKKIEDAYGNIINSSSANFTKFSINFVKTYNAIINEYNNEINFIQKKLKNPVVSAKLEGLKNILNIEEISDVKSIEEAVKYFKLLKKQKNSLKSNIEIIKTSSVIIDIKETEAQLNFIKTSLENKIEDIKSEIINAFVYDGKNLNNIIRELYTPLNIDKTNKEGDYRSNSEIVDIIKNKIDKLDDKLVVLNDSFSNIATLKNEVDKEYKKFIKNQNPETLKDIKYFLTTTRDKITYGVDNVEEFLNENAVEAKERYENFMNSAVNIDNKFKAIEKETTDTEL